MNTIGERIKKIRKDNKLTQIYFATELGISQTHVSKIEKGFENPSETLLRFISYRFSVNLLWLKTGEGNYFLEHGCDKEGLLGTYYLHRKNYEDMMDSFNNDSLWEYVTSISQFIKCLTIDFGKCHYDEQRTYLTHMSNITQILFLVVLSVRDKKNITEIIDEKANRLIIKMGEELRNMVEDLKGKK